MSRRFIIFMPIAMPLSPYSRRAVVILLRYCCATPLSVGFFLSPEG